MNPTIREILMILPFKENNYRAQIASAYQQTALCVHHGPFLVKNVCDSYGQLSNHHDITTLAAMWTRGRGRNITPSGFKALTMGRITVLPIKMSVNINADMIGYDSCLVQFMRSSESLW